MISNPGEVYDLASLLIASGRAAGRADIAQRLDDALHVGSSQMEILGSIAAVLVDEAEALSAFVDPAELKAAVRYVETAFGKE